MSVDGPGIVESDLGHDVYNEILDLYDAGVEVSDIRVRLASYYEADPVDDMDKEIYLAASAKAFWEIGHLDKQLSARLSDLVQGGKSLALWEQAADPALAKERKGVLGRLLRQISVPRKTPRPRKKYTKVSTKLFAVGDCLSLDADGQVHRGVVCKILEYRGQCEYAMLVMEGRTESTVESFVSGSYYGHRIPQGGDGFVFGPHVIRPEHRMLKRSGNPFVVIGHVELDPSKFTLGSFGGVLEMRHVIEDFVRTKKSAAAFRHELLPLRELLKG